MTGSDADMTMPMVFPSEVERLTPLSLIHISEPTRPY